MYTFCHLSMTCCHICCTHQPDLWLPEDGQDIWLKHVGALFYTYKNTVQLDGSEICVYSYQY